MKRHNIHVSDGKNIFTAELHNAPRQIVKTGVVF